MEDLKSLLIGIVGGLIVIAISKAYKSYKKKTIQEDINILEFEKKHLEEMKRSSVEMNRSSFRAVFALFFFIGLANLVPTFFALINIEPLTKSSLFVVLAIWAMFIALSLKFWNRYNNLKNYNQAMKQMEQKLEKLQERLQNN